MIDVTVPAEQEGTKAVVRAWLKQVGDTVALNDPLVELETDKVTQEIAAPAAGVLAEILLDTDADAVPGAVLGRIGESVTSVPPERSRGTKPSEAEATNQGAMLGSARNSPSTALGRNGFVEQRHSPSVKRALMQHGLDPATLTGTGRAGRLTREDVDRALASGPALTASSTADIPHDRMRRAIADNMLRAVTEAPHVTAVFEADFSAIAAHKAALAARGMKLSYTAYILKAAAEAMAAAPAINGKWHDDRIAIAPSIDIGVGTALGDKGLVVPVVRNCGGKSLEEIGAALDDLTARARAGKLTGADVSGGSFTVSNHGVSGSLLAAPIILHAGQAAILGIGKLEKRVIVRTIDAADAILIRPMAYVTLTIDHRVVDGHATNAWLSRFVAVIEGWPPLA